MKLFSMGDKLLNLDHIAVWKVHLPEVRGNVLGEWVDDVEVAGWSNANGFGGPVVSAKGPEAWLLYRYLSVEVVNQCPDCSGGGCSSCL